MSRWKECRIYQLSTPTWIQPCTFALCALAVVKKTAALQHQRGSHNWREDNQPRKRGGDHGKKWWWPFFL